MNESPLKPTDLSEGDANLSDHRRQWTSRLDETTRNWIERDAAVFLHQSLSTPCLNVLGGCGDGAMTDLSGRRILDFHGNSLHQVGYANPAVIAAVKKQLDTLSFCPRRYTNPAAIRLAEKLADIAPGDLNRVLFAPGGTSAVGMALKLARVATGRFKTISMWDAFHGASLDAISVGGEALFRKGIGPLLPGTEHVPPADPRHCLWDPAGRCDGCGLKCARYVDYVMEKEGDVAAVIAEPIRCTRVNPPPGGYWKAVRDACDRHGALLIFDETAVCLGRTGRMFAFEHEAVLPDIVILGKGLGGGVFPLAAIIAREALNVGREIALGHYTHEKNPAACAAGLAAIGYIEEHHLVERSDVLGRTAVGRLKARLGGHPLVEDIRGRGLLFGLELGANGRPAFREAEQIMYECLENGLSFKISGGNFLTLTPALTLPEEELFRALDILEAAVSAAGGASVPPPVHPITLNQRKS
ncbi:aspartate aminotransferase family protein [Desulfococcus sp.]|uniref:(R)-1-hydroxy-2-aminoethylphosphonate ammonia-lyase n=1 Tax=Desulfococcus sp. TaxID=2025834 RepID=UPI0035933A89